MLSVGKTSFETQKIIYLCEGITVSVIYLMFLSFLQLNYLPNLRKIHVRIVIANGIYEWLYVCSKSQVSFPQIDSVVLFS